jgi:hypothetical protein
LVRSGTSDGLRAGTNLVHVPPKRGERRVFSDHADRGSHAAGVELPLVDVVASCGLVTDADVGAVSGGAKLGIPWTLNSTSMDEASFTAASMKTM